ncbi:protein NRT1/ PTR FAMILY 2.9-like [Silene latifolia]|uniref:protein NRT1/ PTR FAMILY 2.9-like n=1 Tax=Silene latifolia TaxID=37657 RepID=UPI003D78247F
MEESNHVVNKPKPEINYAGIKAMPFIIGTETFEKLGAVGTMVNLLMYLTTVFNMKSITATMLVTVVGGTSNLATLLGAFLCDSYFGRYYTLAFASIASFLGLLVIDLTSVFKNLHPAHCQPKQEECQGPTTGQISFLLMGFGLIIIGAAGIRPCNFAFGADQFNPNTESGKRGINSFFNWYFFIYTFAQLVSLTLLVYIQSNVSWSIGLAIPAALMLIGCLLFFMGSKIYVKIRPQGSPIVGLVQVIVAAFRKRELNEHDPDSGSVLKYIASDSINSKLPHTSQFRFLDKAAIITSDDLIKPDGSAANPWRLGTLQQVEEVKCIIRVIPIWASAIVFHIPIVLMNTYVVFQALQSDRRLGLLSFKIPASSYIIFLMISYSLWIPIYDRILVPYLEKVWGKEGGITVLQRIGIGIGLSVLTMLVAGIVEDQRRKTALTKPTLGVFPRKGEISSMSGLWLVFPLSLAGLSEAFTAIGQVEFYYKQFPENMRSVAGSFFFCGMAMSSYLSSLLISIVHKVTEKGRSSGWLAEDLNKGRLDYFYYMVAGLGILNLAYFLACAKWYRYKGTAEYTEDFDVEPLGRLELTDTKKVTA